MADVRIYARIKWFSPARRRPDRLLRELQPFNVELTENADPHSLEGNTARRAWLSGLSGPVIEPWMHTAEPRPTHVLVCDDDALPCPNFELALRRAVDARPNEILQFYGMAESYRGTHRDALERGLTWIDQNVHCCGVMVVMPAPTVRHFLKFWRDELSPHQEVPGDHALQLFAWATRQRIAVSVPALVLEDPELGSTITTIHNRDLWPIPRAVDGARIDWTKTGVRLEQDPDAGIRDHRRFFDYHSATLKRLGVND